MQPSKEMILKMLSELKIKKIPASQIEKELGFSNGLLGKGMLSNEKFDKFNDYFFTQTGRLMSSVITNPVAPQKITVDKIIKDKAQKSITPPSKNNYDKLASLKLVLDKINKDFGEGSVMCMGDVVKKQDNVISTGCIALDDAIGIGGLPCGRMIEIYGQESSGKTTLAIHIIAEAQKLGGRCAIIDTEQAFDAEYAENLNVDLNRLEISQPDYGEQALEITERLIESKNFRVIVVDSVAALIPKRELEGEAGDSAMGKQAWLMSQACRKMVASVAKTNTMLIWINQLRSKIGVMPFQNPWVTTAGNALKFFCSVRLDIASIGKIKDGEEVIGNRTKVKVAKNKMASPFKTAEFDIFFGKGIDQIGELIDIATNLNIVKKSGAWYSYMDSNIGQGKEGVKEVLSANPEMLLEIESKIDNFNVESN